MFFSLNVRCAVMACALSIGLGMASPSAAQSGGDYKVGDRLAAPAKEKAGKGAKAVFREISWDDLIPADWDPQKFFADLQLDDLQDNDPRALEIMARMRAEWDRAPVVERLSGQSVRIPGFVVPLESDGRTIREFLLVPYFGACVHVPPPPANQLIHVIPDKPVPAGMNMSPVWVNGVLNVGRIESEMGSAGYQMRGIRVEEYKEPLPE
ncbi:DUF3299 domain-containing protein [Thauera linaloolentis]|uniref:DUF3299 domain-containing protein n=1 Tax=Thauera linaloolentis (strain DSM 12138 / JCM 21573 / CCUG 41526 / CIP 105981 / IAM 15112 / NBRC 102519 / 47Lol) TaxID=1123367 RepID=N6Y8R6_THAL4|nr:DUF3299 domain-containing protein [Thauera linaloolentis]ENO90721.1 hypothetical protein C666_00805 [Thauera linaloolentis 47Lol = DSM 12138]MCM8565629.1 DUF3299 domain-containing protein [Thauera linaloolentis]